jgi:hypothetical protein
MLATVRCQESQEGHEDPNEFILIAAILSANGRDVNGPYRRR